MLDSGGNPVSGASALSDSGFQYAIARAACDVNGVAKSGNIRAGQEGYRLNSFLLFGHGLLY